MKTRRNLCLVRCVHKTRCLPMFRINRQIPRCVLTWVMVVVLCEPCDGFSDLPSLGGLLFDLEFCLGRGATWVVGLVCFFKAPYLCSGGTWVHVVTEEVFDLSFCGFC